MYCDAECSRALEDEHRRAFWFISGCYHDNHTFAAVMGSGDWVTVKLSWFWCILEPPVAVLVDATGVRAPVAPTLTAADAAVATSFHVIMTVVISNPL